MAYALITGGAKGIGKGIAIALAQRKYNLILVGTDRAALIKTSTALMAQYAVKVNYLAIDVSAPKGPETIFLTTQSYHDELSIVVNNAGIGLNTDFANSSLDEQFNIINVNIKATLKLSHLFIPVLKKRSRAYLLNVGSTTAYQAVPYLNVYAASKAFILSFTRGLRYELKDSNITVSCLCPGSTNTNFGKSARMSAATLQLAGRFNMDPYTVGEIAVKQLLKGKAEIIPGFTNQLHAFFTNIIPKKITENIAGKIYKKEDRKQEAQAVAANFNNIHLNENLIAVE